MKRKNDSKGGGQSGRTALRCKISKSEESRSKGCPLKWDRPSRFFSPPFFGIAFILSYLFYIVKFPYMSYNSEPYAEQGTNFLYHAYKSGLWENIWEPDAGIYLPWLPRAIALIVSSIFSPHLFNYITNFIALAIISFCVSFINHRGLRGIIPNDLNRFVLSLLLSIFVSSYHEIFLFVNFSYFGFIFCTLILFMDKSKIGRPEYWAYATLCALFCISKAHFVIFLPLFLANIFWKSYNKEKTDNSFFFIPSIITIAIQIFFIFLEETAYANSRMSIMIDEGFSRIFFVGLRGFFFWIQSYSQYFRILKDPQLIHLCGLMLMATYIAFCVKLTTNNKITRQQIFLILTLNLLSIGFATVSATHPTHHFNDEKINFSTTYFHFGRATFVSEIFVFISLVIFLFILGRMRIPALLLSLLVAVLGSNTKINDGLWWPFTKGAQCSNWKNYHKLIEEKKFFIPGEPCRWVISNVCQNIHETKSNSKTFVKVDEIVLDRKNYPISLLIHYPKHEAIFAELHSQSGQTVARYSMLSSKKMKNKYIWIGENNFVADKIVLYNRKGKIKSARVVAFYECQKSMNVENKPVDKERNLNTTKKSRYGLSRKLRLSEEKI